MKRLALITGGTSGIGLGAAQSLAAGADLALAFAGNRERAEQARTELIASFPETRIEIFMQPLGSEQDCIQLFDAVGEKFERTPDFLVNSAGRLRDGLFMSTDVQTHLEMMTEHLLVPMALSSLCLKKMYKQRFGRVINISSITARRAKRGQVNYSTVKGGIEAFTRALALEVAHRGVTVNAIAPGLIATPMTKTLIENLTEKHQGLQNVIPAGHAGKPEDIGALIAYLCGEQGGYITGQTIDVAGGRGLGES